MPPDERDRSGIPPDPLAEAIADRTPVATRSRTGSSAGLQLIAEVAEGFRMAASGEDAPGEGELFRWGSLRARRLVGEGSFGEVYAAWDPTLQREVALKLHRNPDEGAGSLALRWIDEARGLARVSHPNVLTVHGASLHGGRAGIWTELVHGRTLEAELLEHGPLPPTEVARIGLDLSRALEAVHRAGLVHGDIKAANVMLDTGSSREPGSPPRIVLMDFSTVAAQTPGETPWSAVAVGTPLAMAPEVLAGAMPSATSDLYSLGVVMFRLLSGRYPVEGSTLGELRANHRTGRRASLRTLAPSCPPRLAGVVERCLAPDPRLRPASARALAAALEHVLDPFGSWRRRMLVPSILLVTLLMATVGVMVARERARERPLRTSAPPRPSQPGLLSAAWSLAGSVPGDELGGGRLAAADFDGDGREDLAIAEATWSGERFGQGRVQVFAGTADGLSSAPVWSFEGRSPQGQLGWMIAPAGDVDGDGYADLLVQERQFYDPATPASVGAVYLFRGSSHGLSHEPAQILRSGDPRVGFGDGLAAAGDMNHDGYGDVLVASSQRRHHHENEGAVMLYLGGPKGLREAPVWITWGGQPGANWGWGLGPTGDVNGDGWPDVLIGAPHWNSSQLDAGRVCLFLGGPHGLATTPAWVHNGDREHAQCGRAAGFIGDLDGDGCDEFAVAATFFSSQGIANRGMLEIFRGGRNGPAREPWRVLLGTSTSAVLGEPFAGRRDLDGDGRPDLVVSSPGWSPRPGALGAGLVSVYSGAQLATTREPLWTFSADTATYNTAATLAVLDRGRGREAGVVVGLPGAPGVGGGDGRVLLFRKPEADTRRH